MRASHLSRKLPKFLLGVVLTFTGSGWGMVAVQALPSQPARSDTLNDGTYLYGEVPQPEQLGKGYVVFAHQQGKVVGAFYYPRSEFDCFSGSLKNNILNVKSVGIDAPDVVELTVSLSDFHRLPIVSANDQRILKVCQQAKSPSTSKQPALPTCTSPKSSAR
jgi:hypothetical protein